MCVPFCCFPKPKKVYLLEPDRKAKQSGGGNGGGSGKKEERPVQTILVGPETMYYPVN
ncbi:hypothetical protein KEM52_004098, partial [Ascosphaera acerosa]